MDANMETAYENLGLMLSGAENEGFRNLTYWESREDGKIEITSGVHTYVVILVPKDILQSIAEGEQAVAEGRPWSTIDALVPKEEEEEERN